MNPAGEGRGVSLTPVPRRQVSLARGSGARRLLEARCRASIQLLLVQGSGELWAAHGQQLEQRSVVILLDMLARMGGHARAINADGPLRRDLAVAQASDQVRPRLSAGMVSLLQA